jgi:hypothetical protein
MFGENPSVIIRDLRDLTRARTTLSQEHSRIAKSAGRCQHKVFTRLTARVKALNDAKVIVNFFSATDGPFA